MKVIDELFNLKDEKYKELQAKIIPNIKVSIGASTKVVYHISMSISPTVQANADAKVPCNPL